jgi:hypothetical protein
MEEVDVVMEEVDEVMEEVDEVAGRLKYQSDVSKTNSLRLLSIGLFSFFFFVFFVFFNTH